jgi:riboflavin kinase/FMN adenylyltransferase
MTFDPHPRLLFEPNREPFLLTPHNLKTRLIESLGFDYIFMQKFDRQFSACDAEEFVKLLVDDLGTSHIVIGHDYTFGFQAKGNRALREFGVEVRFWSDGGTRADHDLRHALLFH